MEKYYTPVIEEFHVGFRCEIKDAAPPEDDWHEEIISIHYNLQHLAKWIDNKSVRVKYLDQQDIEAEGWETYGEVEWKMGNWMLTEYKNNEVLIENCQDFQIPMYAIFKIKNRSELSRIMQQLGIK